MRFYWPRYLTCKWMYMILYTVYYFKVFSNFWTPWINSSIYYDACCLLKNSKWTPQGGIQLLHQHLCCSCDDKGKYATRTCSLTRYSFNMQGYKTKEIWDLQISDIREQNSNWFSHLVFTFASKNAHTVRSTSLPLCLAWMCSSWQMKDRTTKSSFTSVVHLMWICHRNNLGDCWSSRTHRNWMMSLCPHTFGTVNSSILWLLPQNHRCKHLFFAQS